MKRVLKHRLTISLAVLAVVIAAGSYVPSSTYPVAFGIIWAVCAVTLGYAVVSIRRDLNDA